MNGATYHWAIVGTGEAEVRLMEVKDNYAFNRLIARVVLTVDGWKATIENVPTSLLVGHFVFLAVLLFKPEGLFPKTR